MSVFKVKKELVVQAAKNAIEQIKTSRKELLDKEVDKIMRRRMRMKFLCIFLFGKFKKDFKDSLNSRYSAKEFVVRTSDFLDSWRCHGWVVENHANKLLDACFVTESGLVELDNEDAAFVRKWAEKS
jgi:hypothetical protein